MSNNNFYSKKFGNDSIIETLDGMSYVKAMFIKNILKYSLYKNDIKYLQRSLNYLDHIECWYMNFYIKDLLKVCNIEYILYGFLNSVLEKINKIQSTEYDEVMFKSGEPKESDKLIVELKDIIEKQILKS